MNTPARAHLLAFTQIDPYTYGIRFACPDDTGLFQEIIDTIKACPSRYRRWDPDLFDGKGGWTIDESVCEDLFGYFPSLKRRMQALGAYKTSSKSYTGVARASTILTTYSDLINLVELYKRIEANETLLKFVRDADLRPTIKQQQRAVISQFEELLDRQVKTRLDELTNFARKDLDQESGCENTPQKSYTGLLEDAKQWRSILRKQEA